MAAQISHSTEPNKGNKLPGFPKWMSDKGIEGKVTMKLKIGVDGKPKGAKILKVTSNATTDSDKKKAKGLMLKAVQRVVQKWTYKPATLDGKAIEKWLTVTIPFKIKTR